MAHTFKLSAETWKKLCELRDALNDEVLTHRDAWDERSEQWRESDKGEAADTWIEGLADLVDSLDNVDEEPEE